MEIVNLLQSWAENADRLAGPVISTALMLICVVLILLLCRSFYEAKFLER